MRAPASNADDALNDIYDALESRSGTVKFSAGSRIFEQGERGDCAYMIEHGHVEVSRVDGGSRTVLGLLGPGEIFGEMAMLDDEARSATALALHETSVVCISRNQLQEALDEASPLARLLVVAAINRLRVTQSRQPLDVDATDLRANRESGVNRHYEAACADAAEALRRRLGLERAIAERQFELVYQPIISLADGRTAGFEALVRWPRPSARTISPAEFIPLAEATGLIVPLGLWVLESALQALATLGRREDIGPGAMFMSVNVSPRQIDTEVHTEQLARAIERADVCAESIKLEITEQTLLSDPRMATIGLARLKATGAKIAIDDFGTGYSSLNYLHRFPLDTLKIDRSFVQNIAQNAGSQRVVSAIIGLARELDMDIVAEGIEELDELHWLQSRGCQFGQGYLMAKPASFRGALDNLHRTFEW